MENNSLTEIIKSRREAGEGVFSSIGGATKEKLKEKLDWRKVRALVRCQNGTRVKLPTR